MVWILTELLGVRVSGSAGCVLKFRGRVLKEGPAAVAPMGSSSIALTLASLTQQMLFFLFWKQRPHLGQPPFFPFSRLLSVFLFFRESCEAGLCGSSLFLGPGPLWWVRHTALAPEAFGRHLSCWSLKGPVPTQSID